MPAEGVNGTDYFETGEGAGLQYYIKGQMAATGLTDKNGLYTSIRLPAGTSIVGRNRNA